LDVQQLTPVNIRYARGSLFTTLPVVVDETSNQVNEQQPTWSGADGGWSAVDRCKQWVGNINNGSSKSTMAAFSMEVSDNAILHTRQWQQNSS